MVCLGLELRDGRLRQIHWAMAEPSGNDTNLYETCLMFTLKWKSTFPVQNQINLDGGGDLVVAIPALKIMTHGNRISILIRKTQDTK